MQIREAMKQKAAELQGARLDKEFTTRAMSIDEDSHTAVFVMSTATPDRHGDVVEQESWILEHIERNPAFFWAHRSDEFPLGKWLSVWLEADPDSPEGMILVGKAEFAVDLDPQIERAWKHVVRGDLTMVSVGFIPHVVEYDEEKEMLVLKNCELLECSLVGIGSNRRALVRNTEDIRQNLIDTKEAIEQGDMAETARSCAIRHLNKAIRHVKSER